NKNLQQKLSYLSKEELLAQIQKIGVPTDLKIDFDSHKRLVRALEILLYLQQHAKILQPQRVIHNYLVFGLCPPLEQRRASITRRLRKRLQKGLIEEVENLIKMGLKYDDLIYYGLEYK